jgi:hypothetical protein
MFDTQTHTHTMAYQSDIGCCLAMDVVDCTRRSFVGVLPTLLSAATGLSTLSQQRAALKILGSTAADDQCADILYGHASEMLVLASNTGDHELRLYALLVLGNVARSDERCYGLVQANALSILLAILQQHFQASSVSTKELDPSMARDEAHEDRQSSIVVANAKITHMAVSALRHLAIASMSASYDADYQTTKDSLVFGAWYCRILQRSHSTSGNCRVLAADASV